MDPGLLGILITKIFLQELLRAALAADHVVALAQLVPGIERLTAETFRGDVHHEPVIYVTTDGVASGTITRHLYAYSHGNPFVVVVAALHTACTFIHQRASNLSLCSGRRVAGLRIIVFRCCEAGATSSSEPGATSFAKVANGYR